VQRYNLLSFQLYRFPISHLKALLVISSVSAGIYVFLPMQSSTESRHRERTTGTIAAVEEASNPMCLYCFDGTAIITEFFMTGMWVSIPLF